MKNSYKYGLILCTISLFLWIIGVFLSPFYGVMFFLNCLLYGNISFILGLLSYIFNYNWKIIIKMNFIWRDTIIVLFCIGGLIITSLFASAV